MTFALVSGAGSVLVELRIHGAVVLPAYAALCLLGTAAVAVDIRHRRLPFALTFAMLGVGLTGFIAQSIADNRYDHLLRAIVGGIAAYVFLLALALAAPWQLGLGDVVFTSILSASLAWLGWAQLLHGMLAAPALALLLRLIVRLWRAGDESDYEFAFGPFLLTGWLLAIVAGS
jgi:leader peptidase (prepilin peptidase)/N-methyltransferase